MTKGTLKVNGFNQPYSIGKKGNEYVLVFEILPFTDVYAHDEKQALENAKLQLMAKGYKIDGQNIEGDGC